MLQRAKGIGQPLAQFIDSKHLTVQAIDPAELSPGQFACHIRNAVEGEDGHAPAKVIVIDSLNGYLNAMPEENFLTAQLHELLTYLGHKNVMTILIVAQHGLLGNAMKTTVDTSYLADTVILFRFFEAFGEVKQTISVLKKRNGPHEHTIREFRIEPAGLRVGEILKDFQGVLTGTPHYVGLEADLMKNS